MSSLEDSKAHPVLKPGQHRIDNIADYAASMIICEEGNAKPAKIKKRLNKKNLEALPSLHNDHAKDPPQKSVCSPTNSMCSQTTALSRARTAIEGRRKSRAAARARISAALDDVQTSNSKDRSVTKERAWAALAEIQRSRSFSSKGGINSMRSSSKEEEDEHRQPVASTLCQVEESREENNADRVGQVITVGKADSSRVHREKVIEPAEDISEVMKSRGKGEKDKKSKERKKRESRSDKEKYINHVAPASAFVLTEEALLAMSQAALEVAPKIDTFQSMEDDGYIQEKNGVESRANEENGRDVLIADDWYSLASSKAKRRSSSSSKKTQKSVNSSVSLSQKAFMAANQATLNVMDSFEPIEEEPVERDEVMGIVSEDEVSDINDRSLDRTVSEASTQPYTNTDMTQRKSSPGTVTSMGSRFEQNTVDVAMKMESARSAREERKQMAQEPTPRTTSNESTVPDNQGSLSENDGKDSCQPQPTAAVDTPKSEDASQNDISLSSSSSSWENEQINVDQIVKKPIEIDKDLGHLDSMMFQGKGLEQLTMSDTMNSKRPEIDTGLTRSNNSEDSGNTHTSSYSSEHTQDLTPAKSMGPVWQKAIDDAQKALHPKSEKKSQALIHVEEDETVADDETVFSVRPGFSKERLQYAGKYIDRVTLCETNKCSFSLTCYTHKLLLGFCFC